MKNQVKQNADLKKLETESMPQQPVMEWAIPTWTPVQAEWGIVPEFNAQTWADKTMWAAPAPGVQWGSPWASMPQVTNISWTNQETWVTL
jgi:hypothetical protein